MTGPGAGEVRLSIEAGASRFPVRGLLKKGPVTAESLLEALPMLVAELKAYLERVKAREDAGDLRLRDETKSR